MKSFWFESKRFQKSIFLISFSGYIYNSFNQERITTATTTMSHKYPPVFNLFKWRIKYTTLQNIFNNKFVEFLSNSQISSFVSVFVCVNFVGLLYLFMPFVFEIKWVWKTKQMCNNLIRIISFWTFCFSSSSFFVILVHYCLICLIRRRRTLTTVRYRSNLNLPHEKASF